MKRTLYLKFLLAYIIFGVFGLVIVTTFVPTMIQDHLVKEKSAELYSQGNLIADTYASSLYRSETSLEEVKEQLDFLAHCTDSVIQIINPSGR